HMKRLSAHNFLGIFEAEWAALKSGPLKVEDLTTRPELMVPFRSSSPLQTAHDQFPFRSVAPMDMSEAFTEEQKAAHSARVFMVLRLLFTSMLGKEDHL